jgi:hypothetical protein
MRRGNWDCYRAKDHCGCRGQHGYSSGSGAFLHRRPPVAGFKGLPFKQQSFEAPVPVGVDWLARQALQRKKAHRHGGRLAAMQQAKHALH